MAIEIVDFPIKNGDFPWQNVSSPEGIDPLQKHAVISVHMSIVLVNYLTKSHSRCSAGETHHKSSGNSCFSYNSQHAHEIVPDLDE